MEPATYAVRQAVFKPSTLNVPLGSRYSLGALNYAVSEKVRDGVYKLRCETAGRAGNEEFGQLIPIDYLDGLESADLEDVLIPGEDEEETEHLRQRYFESLNSQAFGGNIADYRQKVAAIDGVGGVKVYPVWNGGGTVKLVIIDSEFKSPSSVLIDNVQTVIDPTQNQGSGSGLAPIGHVVTVEGCRETPVDIASRITLQEGWGWEDVLPYVKTCIDDYFHELASSWDSADNLIVRISQVETRLLDLTGILDIADTTLNGAAQNLVIEPDNIPIKGEISNV